MEGKGFRDRSHDFQEKNAVVLGASFDSPEENRAFKEKFDFGYDLLCDTDRKTGLAYGAADDVAASHPKRISYLIDPEGMIVKVYDPVKPADHPAEVLADLETLA